MRSSQNLLHKDLAQKIIDRKIILGLEVYGAMLVMVVVVLFAAKFYLQNSIDSISIDKNFVNGIQLDIDKTDKEIQTINDEILKLNNDKAKYATDMELRGQHYKTQNLLRRLVNYKPKGVSIVSIECNNSKVGLSDAARPSTGNVIMEAAGQIADNATAAVTGTGQKSIDFITGPDGELYDRESGMHVDSVTFEILKDGKTLDNAVAGGGKETSDQSTTTQASSDATATESAASSNNIAVLGYDKDLSGSTLIIRGYADTMESLSKYVTNLNQDYLYIKSYEMTGVQEYELSGNVKLSVFEITLTLEE